MLHTQKIVYCHKMYCKCNSLLCQDKNSFCVLLECGNPGSVVKNIHTLTFSLNIVGKDYRDQSISTLELPLVKHKYGKGKQ